MKIHFNHAPIQAIRYKEEILKITAKVINSGVFLKGDQNQSLKRKLQDYFGCGYITNTASGHDALLIALSALNLNNRDEVIFPVNAYPTAFPVFMSKAKPLAVDVDENGQMDPEDLKNKITKKTKVVILVHLYGLVGKLKEILEIIKNKDIILIEDCAQAFGSTYKGKPVGTFGDIACFSFYPTKNLGTLGDGGALWTRHKRFYKFFLSAKKYGEKKKYHSHFLSGHSRLPEIQAAILNIYFKNIFNDLQKKRKLEIYYNKLLSAKLLSKYIRILKSHPCSAPALHLFVITAKKRDGLKRYLQNIGIETLIHYPYPVHQVAVFKPYFNIKEQFQRAERLKKYILSLPFHQYLTKKQIKFIVQKIKDFYIQYEKA